MRILITGGLGFIGSALVRKAVGEGHDVINLDAGTYAANPANVADVADSGAYVLEALDLRDAKAVAGVFERHRPEAVMHLAAETHNDRAIEGPRLFVETNVLGTANLLEGARAHWMSLDDAAKAAFRFLHVSTDEVFGALGDTGAFDETTPYDPNSPYSASKAGADMLVRAWGRTYGLPVLLTNCANNYGPFQFPEKLIPTVVSRAMEGRSIPIYGQGLQVRDWLHVDDHAEALLTVLARGRLGETYVVGGEGTMRNIDLVHILCAALDRHAAANRPHAEKIEFVADRPGHDWRYAIDATKIREELGWRPKTPLDEGLDATVRWYVDNQAWLLALRERGFTSERLGLTKA